MAITKDQLEARKSYIGSSDAPIIVLGRCYESPWSSGLTPYSVYMDKTVGRKVKESAAMSAGNYLEPAILNWAEDKIGKPFIRDMMYVHDNKILAANFDGLGDPGNGFIVEAKSSGIVGNKQEEWGRAGKVSADAMLNGDCPVPHRVVIQVQHQLFVAGPSYQTAYVACLRAGPGFGLYVLPRSEELIAVIIEKELAFWTNHVIPRIPPPKPDDWKDEEQEKEAA